jgi:hypothetical protein
MTGGLHCAAKPLSFNHGKHGKAHAGSASGQSPFGVFRGSLNCASGAQAVA